MKDAFLLLVIACAFCFCGTERDEVPGEKPVLLSSREIPLGGVSLIIYEDSTFEFVTRGLSSATVYPGKVQIKDDSLFFAYQDSIPYAGSVAIMSTKYVVYIDGSHRWRLEIRLNELSEKLDSTSTIRSIEKQPN